MTAPGDRWEVVIADKGRCGTIEYREDSGSVPFYWEFGGGGKVAIISGPKPAEWDLSHSWARERRTQIMRRVAETVIRRQGPWMQAGV